MRLNLKKSPYSWRLVFLSLVFFAILTPILENHIPAWKRYNQIQEEQNLDSGALYYSNVPQTQEAEETTRRAVKEGMAERRKARQEQKN